MSWDLIISKLKDPNVLSYFSLLGLPVKQSGFGESAEMNLLAFPFSASVFSERDIHSDHLNYLSQIDWAPKFVEKAFPFKAQYQQSFLLTPAAEAQSLSEEWGLLPSVYGYPADRFSAMMDRNFLLNNPDHSIPVIPSYSFDSVSAFLDRDEEQLADEIVKRLGMNLAKESFSKVLFRKERSVQGDSVKIVHSLPDLIALLKGKSLSRGLFTRVYGEEEILHNVGLAIGMHEGRATLLGCTEQNSKNFRHYGSKTTDFGSDLKAEFENVVVKFGALLASKGVDGGIFGVEGFVVKRNQNKDFSFLAYDLNPCVSQGFFTLLFRELLARKFGLVTNVSVSLHSVFVAAKQKVSFPWINPTTQQSGVFPLIFTEYPDFNLPYRRIVTMVASIDEADPEENLARWKKTLVNVNGNKILKMNEMFF